MPPLLLRRPLSPIEVGGQWIALAAAIATMTALLQSEFVRLYAVPFDRSEWSGFAGEWLRTFFGTLPIIVVAALATNGLPERRSRRWPMLVLAMRAAVALGWYAERAANRLHGTTDLNPRVERAILHTLVVTAILLAALGEYRQRFERAADALHQTALAALRLQGELAAGRLQLLQAQVEPHFLFNSLANVRRLLRIDGEAGRMMLIDLLHYLESALPRLRDETPTLAREVEVTRAFLAVHQVRMGPRLHVEFDVPAELGVLVVPPMMLITLVENALKHGLQPLLEGGSIRVSAERSSGTLRISVADTGRGLGAGYGAGHGLSNLRERLRSMYGAAGALALRVNQPRGVVATLEWPVAA